MFRVCTYEVYIDNVKSQLKNAKFLAIEVYETTEVSCKSQFATIIRYVEDCAPVKRFLYFIDVHDRSGYDFAKVVVDELTPYE